MDGEDAKYTSRMNPEATCAALNNAFNEGVTTDALLNQEPTKDALYKLWSKVTEDTVNVQLWEVPMSMAGKKALQILTKVFKSINAKLDRHLR